MRLVRSRSFGTHGRSRKHLAGIRKVLRSERAAHQLHSLQIGLGEHFRHHRLLLLAHAMFSGDGAAALHAEPQDIYREFIRTLLLAWDADVIQHQGMQIAVARVEDVGHSQARGGAHPFDFAKNFWERGTWDDAILHEVVRRDASHGGESGFSTLPNNRTLRFRLSDANLPRAALRADLAHLFHQVFDLGGRAVEFHQQQSAAIRISGVHRGLGRLDRKIVHHLDGGGEHARGNDPAHGSARFVGGIKGGQQRLDDFGLLHDAQHDFGGDAQRAFRSDKNSCQIVSGSVDGTASKMYERSVGENHLEGQHVGSGESVFQTMRAARVLRHVASDAAHRLGRWIGSIEESLWSNPLRDLRVNHTRLNHYARIRDINFQDAVHAHQTDDNATFDRQCATAQSRARTPGHKRDFFATTDAQDGLHFRSGLGQQNRRRHNAKIGHRVNSTKMTPGQSVGFARGGVWRETLTPGQSGTAASPITFGAYGTGVQPIISGANITSWTQGNGTRVPTTVWYTAQTTNPYWPSFSGLPGVPKSSLSAVIAANEWYWDGSSTLYVYATSNPAYTVEIPTRDYAVNSVGLSYLTFTNLEMRGAAVRSEEHT